MHCGFGLTYPSRVCGVSLFRRSAEARSGLHPPVFELRERSVQPLAFAVRLLDSHLRDLVLLLELGQHLAEPIVLGQQLECGDVVGVELCSEFA